MMKHSCLLLFCSFVFACKQPAPINNSPVPYRLEQPWPQLPKDFVLGSPSGMAVDSAQRVIVFHRARKTWPLLFPFSNAVIAENTIAVLRADSGTIINEWGAGIFIMPHSLTVDSHNDIWVTDVGLQQVLKFNHAGQLMLRVGQAGVAGNDSLHFNRPTDVAVADDGSFYVSDGYGNSRVVKFSADGHYQFSWGHKGSGPGEFSIPHGIDIDKAGRVYVADRENNRIQVFDSTGHFLKEWADHSYAKMYAVRIDKKTQQVICADYHTNYISPDGSNIRVFDTAGNRLLCFGRSGGYNGPVCRYHTLAIDSLGNIYTGDILKNRLQKFSKALH